MYDLDAYLRRIGLGAGEAPSLEAIHRAHATAIPFENLDSHRGVPVSLEPERLERKLVADRRGGYCFEHNLLLAAALEHLGLRVEPMLARVRAGGAARDARPLGHLVLRVTDAEGREWHADVGFGLGTLLDPIPFGPSGVHRQSGWSFQVVEDDDELVLQTLGANGWEDVYGFRPERAASVDLEVSNWWICTSPSSPFVSGLICCVNHPDGRREALCDWSGATVLMTVTPEGTTEEPQPRSRIPSLLVERFGLHGFVLGHDDRVARAEGS